MPEKKYLDIEGVKTLYRELSLQDYPNNDILAAVITAIDAAKADKEHSHTVTDVTNLQTILDELNIKASKQADWSQTDETAPDYIKNKPDSIIALEALAETNIAKPAYNNNMLYTNNNGSIYVL